MRWAKARDVHRQMSLSSRPDPRRSITFLTPRCRARRALAAIFDGAWLVLACCWILVACQGRDWSAALAWSSFVVNHTGGMERSRSTVAGAAILHLPLTLRHGRSQWIFGVFMARQLGRQVGLRWSPPATAGDAG